MNTATYMFMLYLKVTFTHSFHNGLHYYIKINEMQNKCSQYLLYPAVERKLLKLNFLHLFTELFPEACSFLTYYKFIQLYAISWCGINVYPDYILYNVLLRPFILRYTCYYVSLSLSLKKLTRLSGCLD